MRRWIIGVVLLGMALLAGCDNKSGSTDTTSSADVTAMTVLAGSELKDIEPLLPQIESATGIRLKLQYVGTLDAVEQLQGGKQYDFAWLASNKYALLTPGAKERIKASERIMVSPVILGVRQEKARELGWTDPAKPPTWQDIAQAAGAAKFRFAMTNPASSNTGFAAILGLAAAVSGRGEAMELKDIDFKALGSFARAQALTAGSSGWLAEVYEREAGTLDGMVNYASVLQSLNASGRLKEPMFLVYPKDGVITADYPFMLINEQQRASYTKLVDYLKGEAFQQAMTKATYRQPVNPAVQSAMPAHDYFELAFPAKLEVVNGLLDSYLNTVRKPADATFVVDISGSMSGARLDQLRTALTGLAGQDSSLSGRFSRLRDREHVTLLRFSDHVVGVEDWALGSNPAANNKILQSFVGSVNALNPTGGTAIYSATRQAYEAALARQKRDPERVYTLLLMTDGENNAGLSLDGFTQWLNSLPPEERKIRIFAVQFGEARRDELVALTQPTGGRVFDATQSGLQAVFKEIRGYQ